MRFITEVLGVLGVFVAGVSGARVLKASSLVTCMENSAISATNFDVSFTPDNRTVTYDVTANVEISGNATALITVYAYGIQVIQETLNPCKLNIDQLCPMTPGQIDIQSHSTLTSSIVNDIPGVAYTVPDLDAEVYVQVFDDTNTMQACIQASFINTKTVNHLAIKWVTAIIAGIGLLTSAVLATRGSSYTAAHVSTNSMALFCYFQSVVIVAMEAVERVPPIASSWAQNLVWSMGLIEVDFMQQIFRWYVQATGGDPTTYVSFRTIAILVQKRSNIVHPRVKEFLLSHAAYFTDFAPKASALIRRTEQLITVAQSTLTLLVLRGIKRMAFQAGIEQTSVVLTGFTFFVLICLAMTICFVLFRYCVVHFFKNRFLYFRLNWRVMLKGALLRLVFIGFPQLLILSLWEFVERDSAAVIILAVFFLILCLGILCWNTFKVIIIGQKSIQLHGTPAYLLYSDSQVVNKYGFLYSQFAATHYYFIALVLGYTFLKACFISFAQSSGKTQGLAIFLIELAYLILVCWKRPYMDKMTNVINITICAIMTLNALFFLFFSGLFGQPQVVSSVMGVIFFVLNAAFSLFLLLFTLITCGLVLFAKNPDNRYKPAKDDRASFIQDQNIPNPDVMGEFTALGDAARADHDDSILLPQSRVYEEDSMSYSLSNPFNEKRQSGYESATASTLESDMGTPQLPESKESSNRGWPL
jgi:hypothetical protein